MYANCLTRPPHAFLFLCMRAGYLFYFQHAVSTEPCGVVPLENSEFFIHSYASTEELSNFCFELRTPARPWGASKAYFVAPFQVITLLRPIIDL